MRHLNFGRSQARGVLSMFRKWSVARLTVHVGMHALGFGLHDVGMAHLARLVTGIHHRPGGDLGKGVTTVMTIFSKAVRQEGVPQNEEEH